MKKNKDFTTLEEGILILQQEAKSSSLSIGEILHILSGKGRPLILIFLSLPFCQPLQIPGLSTPFGLAIAFLGLRMAFGKHVWLPKMALSYTITKQTLQKITSKILLLVRKMKRFSHPRLNWLCHSSFMEIINSLTIFILGIFLALPLPIPLTNLTAAWSIFLIALGVLQDDGIFVLVGYVASFLTILFFVAMALSIKHTWIFA